MSTSEQSSWFNAAVVAAAIALIAQVVGTILQGWNQIDLEKERRETELILNAVRGVGSQAEAQENLLFFVRIGLIQHELADKIRDVPVDQFPVLPIAGQQPPACRGAIAIDFPMVPDTGNLNRVRLTVTAMSIAHGTSLELQQVTFDVGCKDGLTSPNGRPCSRNLAYLGNETMLSPGVTVVPSGNVFPISFKFTPKQIVPANTAPGAELMFEFDVEAQGHPGDDIVVLAGLTGVCDNGIPTIASQEAFIGVQ